MHLGFAGEDGDVKLKLEERGIEHRRGLALARRLNELLVMLNGRMSEVMYVYGKVGCAVVVLPSCGAPSASGQKGAHPQEASSPVG